MGINANANRLNRTQTRVPCAAPRTIIGLEFPPQRHKSLDNAPMDKKNRKKKLRQANSRAEPISKRKLAKNDPEITVWSLVNALVYSKKKSKSSIGKKKTHGSNESAISEIGDSSDNSFANLAETASSHTSDHDDKNKGSNITVEVSDAEVVPPELPESEVGRRKKYKSRSEKHLKKKKAKKSSEKYDDFQTEQPLSPEKSHSEKPLKSKKKKSSEKYDGFQDEQSLSRDTSHSRKHLKRKEKRSRKLDAETSLEGDEVRKRKKKKHHVEEAETTATEFDFKTPKAPKSPKHVLLQKLQPERATSDEANGATNEEGLILKSSLPVQQERKRKRFKKYLRTKKKLVINPSSESDLEEELETPQKVLVFSKGDEVVSELEELILMDLVQEKDLLEQREVIEVDSDESSSNGTKIAYGGEVEVEATPESGIDSPREKKFLSEERNSSIKEQVSGTTENEVSDERAQRIPITQLLAALQNLSPVSFFRPTLAETTLPGPSFAERRSQVETSSPLPPLSNSRLLNESFTTANNTMLVSTMEEKSLKTADTFANVGIFRNVTNDGLATSTPRHANSASIIQEQKRAGIAGAKHNMDSPFNGKLAGEIGFVAPAKPSDEASSTPKSISRNPGTQATPTAIAQASSSHREVPLTEVVLNFAYLPQGNTQLSIEKTTPESSGGQGPLELSGSLSNNIASALTNAAHDADSEPLSSANPNAIANTTPKHTQPTYNTSYNAPTGGSGILVPSKSSGSSKINTTAKTSDKQFAYPSQATPAQSSPSFRAIVRTSYANTQSPPQGDKTASFYDISQNLNHASSSPSLSTLTGAARKPPRRRIKLIPYSTSPPQKSLSEQMRERFESHGSKFQGFKVSKRDSD